MDAYLKVVLDLYQKFEFFELIKIPCSDNAPADALATLAPASEPNLRRVLPVESIDQPSIDVNLLPPAPATFLEAAPSPHTSASSSNILAVSSAAPAAPAATPAPAPATTAPALTAPANPANNDLQAEIIQYIADGISPNDKWETRRLHAKCAQYTMLDGNLFRRDPNGTLLICVVTKDVNTSCGRSTKAQAATTQANML
ncbi:PREDICTED: uncharacterized protein LOC104748902 [Camelina sativa]|uniref:Uncharacterized protein LOC104748902 n=1 Tax=Camelina sativa TaxID=90675 RepID=A0ABM0WBS0_CAMSA|nr:PREDICTED: uncharacterized protein LOC104748902 [Camelina sativa]